MYGTNKIHPFSDKGLIITRCNNGWILQIPQPPKEQAAMQAMIEALPDAMRRGNEDVIPGMEEEQTDLVHEYVPMHDVIDVGLFVFLSFREMMAFIEISFDSINN